MKRGGHAEPPDLARAQDLERLHAANQLDSARLLELALLYVEPFHAEEKAISILQNLVADEPDNWSARVWLAYLHLHFSMDRASLATATTLLEPLTQLNGAPAAAAFLLLSQVGRELGALNLRQERGLLEKSVAEAPDWVLNHYLLAHCYGLADHRQAALEQLNLAEKNVARSSPPTKAESEFESAITARTAQGMSDAIGTLRHKLLQGDQGRPHHG